MRVFLAVGLVTILFSCQKDESFTGDTGKLGQVAVEDQDPVSPQENTEADSTPAAPTTVESEPFQQFELQFEDWIDFDFDIYFCAKGEYRLKTDQSGYSRIESLADQTIQMNSGKLTDFGCANKLLVKHIRDGAVVQERLVDLQSDQDVFESLSFEVLAGDLIDPIFQIGAGNLCDADQTTGLEITIQDPERSRIYYSQDQCQTGLCKCPFF